EGGAPPPARAGLVLPGQRRGLAVRGGRVRRRQLLREHAELRRAARASAGRNRPRAASGRIPSPRVRAQMESRSGLGFLERPHAGLARVPNEPGRAATSAGPSAPRGVLARLRWRRRRQHAAPALHPGGALHDARASGDQALPPMGPSLGHERDSLHRAPSGRPGPWPGCCLSGAARTGRRRGLAAARRRARQQRGDPRAAPAARLPERRRLSHHHLGRRLATGAGRGHAGHATRAPNGRVADGRFPTMLEPARTMAPRARFDKDYYRTIGLHPEATDDEIRRAYRRLALEWHPDRRPRDATAAERFKEISEAYAVLIDPARRRDYDAARRAGAPGAFRANRDDLFRDLFANARASAIFEELAREFERIGMRVDRQYFH